MRSPKFNGIDVSNFSITRWAVLFGVSIFFLFLPYQDGLFNSFTYSFEMPLYEAMLFVFSVFLVALAFIARRLKYDNIEFIFSIGMLLMPFLYWLSSFQAVSYHNAILMVFVYGLYSVFFLSAQSVATTKAARFASEIILFLSGYAIIIYGLLASLGHVLDQNAVWFTNNTYRLASVFEYPNTYAGFLLAFFLCAAFAAVNAKNIIVSAIHSLMLVPIWISLMLTYSRGALVLVPLLVLIILVFLRLDLQIAYAGTLLLSVAAAFMILSPFTNIYFEIAQRVLPSAESDGQGPLSIWNSASLKGWMILAGTSVVTAIIILGIRAAMPWMERRLAPWSGRRFAPFFLPVAGMAAGILLAVLLLGTNLAQSMLPQSIADRLANINFRQHSVLERLTFYRDGLKVSVDYPLLGAGGGGWTALYEQYQNNPYISRQAHSFIIQTLVEVGWLGLLVLIALIGCIFFFYLKNYWKEREQQPGHFFFFILVFSLLTHSLIDFDMSFAYIGAVVFFSLGTLAAVYKDEAALPRLRFLNSNRWRFVYPAILAVVTFALIVQVYQEFAAVHYYRQAVHMAAKENRPLEEAVVPLDQAIANSPKHPLYFVTKIDWMRQAYFQTADVSYLNEAKSLIERIKQAEPYERQIILEEYRNHKDLGEYIEAIESLEEGISKFQWDIKFYEAAIMEYAVNGQRLQDSDPETAQTYWNRGIALYGEILRRMELLETLPEEQLQGRNFEVTAFTRQAVGQIYYYQQRYQDAVEILEPLREGDLNDQYVRVGTRYYLASLHKLGHSDENLLNRLIEFDPGEKIALEALIGTLSKKFDG